MAPPLAATAGAAAMPIGSAAVDKRIVALREAVALGHAEVSGMCVYIYKLCIYIYIHIDIYSYMCVRVHNIYTYVHVYMYIYVYMWRCARRLLWGVRKCRVCVYTYIYIPKYIYTNI